MKIPSNFIITPTSQTGDVYATEFVFKSNVPTQYTKFAWSLGDSSKIVYNQSKVTHAYQYPGLYTVGLSAWTDYGDFATDYATINVDYAYRDSLTFSQIPSTFGVPGVVTNMPFIVSLTSAKIDQPIALVLHSYNSRSVPNYAVPDKWSFITPRWRFKDLNGKVLESVVPIKTTPIYKNGKKVAVTANYKFYYVDDVSTGVDVEHDCPIMVIASLSTQHFTYPPESIVYPYASYSNTEIVQAAAAWQIIDCIPTSIKITENFINPIYPIKWANVPIPLMLTVRSDSSKISSYALAEAAPQFDIDAFSYPKTNELGKLHAVVICLSSKDIELQENVHYKRDYNTDLHFQSTDQYGNISSGYIFTSITPLSPIPGEVFIKANTIALNAGANDRKYAFEFPIGYPIYYDCYISHSLKSFYYKISYAVDSADCPFVKYYKGLDILARGTATIVPTPSSTETTGIDNYTLPLTGHGNVYALTFNPIKNRLYVADVEFNTISCYQSGTNLLTSIQLEQRFDKQTLGPTCIAIDNWNNVWVSLFDDRKILKFDYQLNYILSAAPHPEFEEPLRAGLWLEPKNPTFSPPMLETDRLGYVWVCYPSNEAPSRLYKFDQSGNTLLSADLPENASPISLSIGSDNSLWVACKSTDEIIAFQSNGKRLSSDGTFSPHLTAGIVRPSYICHDRAGNLCILHGYNLYSYYNLYTNTLKTWEINTKKNTATIVGEIISEKNYDLDLTEIWGGLDCDVYNRMWALDSEVNKALISLPHELSAFQVVPLDPEIHAPFTTYIIKGGDTSTTMITASEEMGIRAGLQRSIQAGGDWTGNRWYQKYGSGLVSYPIEGISTPFKIYDLNSSLNIAKINDSWSYSDYFKSLAFPETLQSNNSLFDFFAAAIGDGNSTTESIGGVCYEKIANFVSNRGDVTTSNIDALVSMADQVGVDVKQYASSYPAAVTKLMDLFSVPKPYLMGVPNYETDVTKKIGNLLNLHETTNITITADRFYLIKNKYVEQQRLLYAPKIDNRETYPITELNIEGLSLPIATNYYVFEYNDSLINTDSPHLNNLIDWQNQKLTTITPNMSTDKDWYGDEGIVDMMFNNLLTKQLFGK